MQMRFRIRIRRMATGICRSQFQQAKREGKEGHLSTLTCWSVSQSSSFATSHCSGRGLCHIPCHSTSTRFPVRPPKAFVSTFLPSLTAAPVNRLLQTLVYQDAGCFTCVLNGADPVTTVQVTLVTMAQLKRVARRSITQMNEDEDIPEPSIEATPAFKIQLQELATLCQRLCSTYRPPKNTWQLGDPKPPRPSLPIGKNQSKIKKQDQLEIWGSWPLVSTFWDPAQHGWPPYGVRLPDAWVYIAIKLLSTTERHDKYPADFDGSGMVRQSRVPCGPTFVISAHGVFAYPIFKGYYVLCGEEGRKHCAWLLQRQRDAAGNKFQFKTIIAGPVLPPSSMRPPHSSIVKLPRHRPVTTADSTTPKRLDKAETDRWTVCLDDMVLQYKKPDTYEIMPFAQLSPRLTCTESSESDKLVNRQSSSSTTTTTTALTDIPRSIKRPRPQASTLPATPKETTAVSSPTDFFSPPRASSSSTKQTTPAPDIKPTAKGRGKVKHAHAENIQDPASTPSINSPPNILAAEEVVQNDSKRRRTTAHGQLVYKLCDSFMQTRKHFDTYLASSMEAEKRHEEYLRALEQRQKDHDAYMEATIETFTQIQTCVAYLQKELGGGEPDGGGEQSLAQPNGMEDVVYETDAEEKQEDEED
ncbi:uncharacterized protein BO95DRAFT_484916 [Aspergillus brunneoviolaceus CBS 621.78]|uniref:Uncharacterized protein n=1 Tax=Aspergillus brunneoviolaceus CBS 621.78 TaxID=1450534 RepID=A0ACD1FZ43_9EURO|nr:hypothetical protein BO95DRAFT_484916 [Aspergillus brunneoviolaceus CBS 621.78]RAH42181.1 hypothetical protein BO95DRAFT_484916 [Aspergillus brunneoviolaceus CBS 621.78]